jgi:hypothetical protein
VFYSKTNTSIHDFGGGGDHSALGQVVGGRSIS